MATGFTAGTPLGSQYQYTPITFAPLLSLVPQRPAPAPAPTPTGLEATAQMPVPQYMGEAQGPGGEMQPFSGKMVGEQPFGQVMQDIGRGLTAVMNPLPNLVSLTMFGKTVPELMSQVFGSQQQQTQQVPAPIVSPEAVGLAGQMGITMSEAQGLIDAMGLQGVQAATGMADIAESGAAGAGPSGDGGGTFGAIGSDIGPGE